jgi:hypothetical protein
MFAHGRIGLVGQIIAVVGGAVGQPAQDGILVGLGTVFVALGENCMITGLGACRPTAACV